MSKSKLLPPNQVNFVDGAFYGYEIPNTQPKQYLLAVFFRRHTAPKQWKKPYRWENRPHVFEIRTERAGSIACLEDHFRIYTPKGDKVLESEQIPYYSPITLPTRLKADLRNSFITFLTHLLDPAQGLHLSIKSKKPDCVFHLRAKHAYQVLTKGNPTLLANVCRLLDLKLENLPPVFKAYAIADAL